MGVSFKLGHAVINRQFLTAMGFKLYGSFTTLYTIITSLGDNRAVTSAFVGEDVLKQTHPELFPMMLWIDNFSAHISLPFKRFCKQEGIILMLFRSHATMWSCALDNGPFAAYEKTYNQYKQRK